MIESEIWRALGYLFISGIVVFIWKQASDAVKKEGFRMVLGKGFLLCFVIALFGSFTLGDPTCEVQDDPVYGGCDQYTDDGYTPTTKQRIANFSYFITLLYVPVIFGAFNGKNKNS